MATEAAAAVYPMFDRDNYGKWAVEMSVALKDQGLWGAVNPGGAEYAKGTAKYRLDRFALIAMYSVLPNDVIQRTFDRKSNAKELWGAIKVVCAGVDDTSAHVGQQEAVADDELASVEPEVTPVGSSSVATPGTATNVSEEVDVSMSNSEEQEITSSSEAQPESTRTTVIAGQHPG